MTPSLAAPGSAVPQAAPSRPPLPPPAGEAWPAPTRPTRPAVEGAAHADVTVIGGGLAGLSTALHLRLASPSLSVLVLEAATVAAGASGRGTGLLGPRTGPALPTARRRYGDERARSLQLLSERAVSLVRGLVDEYGIECGMRPAAQLLLARGRGQARTLRRRAAGYAALGLPAPLLGPDDLAPLLGGRYRAALRAEPAATLDPAALARGLAAAAEAHGVRIHERSPVTGLSLASVTSAGYGLDVPKGRVHTGTVVIATNAYSPPGLPVAGVVPLEAQAIATAPVSDAVLELLGWSGREALIEEGALTRHFRLTPDNRIIVGGGRVQHSASTPPTRATRVRQRTWRVQERSLRALHPVLATVPVERAWTGHIAMTRDYLPVIGRVPGAEGIWQVRGWCGHGLAMSVIGGVLIAQAMRGGAGGEDGPWARGMAPGLPQGTAADWLLRRALDALAVMSD